MVDIQTVCCMCGDVGFPDKLFRCSKCHNRFQHSNYYSEFAEPIEQCDWCQSEERGSRHGSSSKKSSAAGSEAGITHRSEYSGGDRIKRPEREDGGEKGKSPSPRTATRRYKLLKDVMC
ncbi:uncharacterized protein LOC127802305 isoform X2 [Diospyros lotus]|uniref:uncharacterized protein LOC127802305 isoform X2 n=1 Tax=Diospyros lotus TaxID=55363 RepID=UPI00224DC9F9|nr:uncharacterized protein LOC127802305 isoform X2 [Diospyros lotus]